MHNLVRPKFFIPVHGEYRHLVKHAKLAQELGMSRSAFFKKTKAVMGCSPSDMVKDFKLSHAVELLKHSGQSITDVAYCCGFTDVGYFGKCFRKKYGMSPREYVAQQQESEIKK